MPQAMVVGDARLSFAARPGGVTDLCSNTTPRILS